VHNHSDGRCYGVADIAGRLDAGGILPVWGMVAEPECREVRLLITRWVKEGIAVGEAVKLRIDIRRVRILGMPLAAAVLVELNTSCSRSAGDIANSDGGADCVNVNRARPKVRAISGSEYIHFTAAIA
jgi:hypothetical protein